MVFAVGLYVDDIDADMNTPCWCGWERPVRWVMVLMGLLSLADRSGYSRRA